MKFIKQQLNDFWQYFKLFGHTGSAASKARFRQYVYTLIVVIITFILASVHLNSTSNSVQLNWTIAFWGGFAIGVGYTSSVRPSILTVSPFSPTQRTVFNYLVSLLYTFIYTFIVTVVMILFILVVAFFAFLATGENMLVFEETVNNSSKWNELLINFAGMFYFFSVYAITHIEKRKIRNTAITIWFVVSEALMLVLVNVVNTASNGGVYQGFAFVGNLATNIDNLAHPWVPSLIAGLLTAVAFVLSIFTSYRSHRSREF